MEDGMEIGICSGIVGVGSSKIYRVAPGFRVEAVSVGCS